MQNPKHLNLLINFAGAALAAIVIGYIAYAGLRTNAEKSCSVRYPAPTRFSLLTHEGKPLSAIELQARAGQRDVGVVANASVVAVEGGPTPEALEVKLRDLPRGEGSDAPARNGIEFRWAPPGVAGATSACLTYSLWLPDQFTFKGGGVLPGAFGGTAGAPRAADDAVSLRPEWFADGQPSLTAVVEGGERRRVSRNTSALPTNRWVKIEQEIVLNDPGQPNGTARLWIDGALIAEDRQVPWRKTATTALTGVLAGAGYKVAPSQSGLLRLSPFEIGWK